MRPQGGLAVATLLERGEESELTYVAVHRFQLEPGGEFQRGHQFAEDAMEGPSAGCDYPSQPALTTRTSRGVAGSEDDTRRRRTRPCPACAAVPHLVAWQWTTLGFSRVPWATTGGAHGSAACRR